MVTVRRPGGNQLVAALYRIPQGAHPDYVALEALARIMTIQPSGRLYQALVDTKKATEVDSSVLDAARSGHAGVLGAGADRPTRSTSRRARCWRRSPASPTTPITDAEVDRVRTRALKAFDDTINDPQRLGVALSESIADGDWRLFFLQRDRWRTLKAADVQRAAKTWLKPANLTIGRFIPDAQPDRTPAAEAVDVARWSTTTAATRRSPPARPSTRRRPTSKRGPGGSRCRAA